MCVIMLIIVLKKKKKSKKQMHNNRWSAHFFVFDNFKKRKCSKYKIKNWEATTTYLGSFAT